MKDKIPPAFCFIVVRIEADIAGKRMARKKNDRFKFNLRTIDFSSLFFERQKIGRVTEKTNIRESAKKVTRKFYNENSRC